MPRKPDKQERANAALEAAVNDWRERARAHRVTHEITRLLDGTVQIAMTHRHFSTTDEMLVVLVAVGEATSWQLRTRIYYQLPYAARARRRGKPMYPVNRAEAMVHIRSMGELPEK